LGKSNSYKKPLPTKQFRTRFFSPSQSHLQNIFEASISRGFNRLLSLFMTHAKFLLPWPDNTLNKKPLLKSIIAAVAEPRITKAEISAPKDVDMGNKMYFLNPMFS